VPKVQKCRKDTSLYLFYAKKIQAKRKKIQAKMDKMDKEKIEYKD